MSQIKRIIGIRAARATARHTAHGLSSKAKRRPMRSVTLLVAGIALGLGAGFAAGRGFAGQG